MRASLSPIMRRLVFSTLQLEPARFIPRSRVFFPENRVEKALGFEIDPYYGDPAVCTFGKTADLTLKLADFTTRRALRSLQPRHLQSALRPSSPSSKRQQIPPTVPHLQSERREDSAGLQGSTAISSACPTHGWRRRRCGLAHSERVHGC